MNRRAIIFICIFSVVLAISGCGKARAGKAKNDVIPVKIMRVKYENLEKTIEYAGNIKGQDEALVYPKVPGKIVEKAKDDGSPVAKGEPILYIDRDEVGLKFEKAPVESPLNGVIGRVYVDIGSNVTPQTPVALVSDMAKAEIDLSIPEKYLPDIRIGQDAVIAVDAYPGETFGGKVTMISPLVDLQTRAAPVQLTIDNPKKLLQSGMLAKVKLIIQTQRGVPVILKEAVIGKAPDTYVYVIEGGKAALRKVTLGLRDGPYYEVTDGLKEGDLVVIMGQQRLRDGSLVAVEE